MIVDVPVVGKIGERVTSYFQDFGEFQCTISATLKSGFLMELDMNPETYDQVQVSKDVVGDAAAYLQPDMTVKLSTHDVNVVSLALPQRVTLEVVETEPVTKGQTASSSYKPAVLSNGVRTTVPPHISVGTRIVVMTEDGSYSERAKD